VIFKIKTVGENNNYHTSILAEHHGAGLIEMQELEAPG